MKMNDSQMIARKLIAGLVACVALIALACMPISLQAKQHSAAVIALAFCLFYMLLYAYAGLCSWRARMALRREARECLMRYC